jgi:hypothetical protein
MKPKLFRSTTVSRHLYAGLAGLLAAASLAVVTAWADDTNVIDPRADVLLHRMSDYLAQAPYFSVKAEIWQDVQLGSGQRVQAGRTVELQLRRPDRLHAEVRSTRRNRAMYYDGKTFSIFNRAENFYGSADIPGTIDDALDTASEKYGMTMPLEDFLVSDPYKSAVQGLTSGTLLGSVTVLDVPCQHLAFSRGNIDWQLWIEDGPRPVPRKFVITYKDEDGSPQFTAIFSHWDFDTKLPDFVFDFQPPAGASKIDITEVKARNQQTQKEAK